MRLYGREIELETRVLGRELVYYEETGSTNDEAKRLAADGGAEGLVVLAGRQSAGRGRLGRSWYSQEASVYMSVVLRPEPGREGGGPAVLTLLAALAVLEALEKECALEQGRIKWPNDVLWRERKLCGILAEMARDRQGKPFLVLGVGVNVAGECFPGDLEGKAASLYMATGRLWERGRVVAAVLRELELRYTRFRETSFSCFREEYKSRCLTLGRKVRFTRDGREMEGQALDLNPDGSLAVVLENGSLVGICAGEVLIHQGAGEWI